MTQQAPWGNVVVNGECMLAGTANYALFGKMCRLCPDYTRRWNRWDMRAIIGAYKTIDPDDSTPPKDLGRLRRHLPHPPCGGRKPRQLQRPLRPDARRLLRLLWEPYRPR